MDDTISRAAVVDAIEGVDWYHINKNGEMVHGANDNDHQAWYKAEDIYKAVESVPSAQPVAKDINVSVKDCISRQAALDALYDWSEHSMTDAEAWHIRQVIGDIKSMPSAQQWISCEERLPEPGVNVLVDVLDIPADDRFPLVDKIGDDGDWCNCYGEWLAVAWMPLPEPWKGEEK